MDAPRPGRTVALAGFYFLYYATVGIALPFLPAYLVGLGLTATQLGLLLALGPLVGLVAPPRWGALVDTSGKAEEVLRLLAWGATLCFLPLLWIHRFVPLALALAGYALFQTSLIPVIDTLTLRHVRRTGGDYARVRLFGSLGFIVASVLFGTWGGVGRRTPITVTLALMVGYALWAFTARAEPGPRQSAPREPASSLLSDRALRRLLVACALHWVACAPYNGVYALHVGALGMDPWVIGISAALGVAAEVVAMATHPLWGRRLSAHSALRIAFAFSGARWLLTAWVDTPIGLSSVALLHGFSFGVFYVAAVADVAARVPEERRASGQALLTSMTFGLGGLVGYALAGSGYDWLGGRTLFVAAAGVELLAVLTTFGGRVAKPCAASS